MPAMTRRSFARIALAGIFLPLALLAAVIPRAILAADEAAPAAGRPKFVRLERAPSGELVALQTSIVRFVSDQDDKAGLTVDLVGAVHVGEKAYYEALNKRFEGYDAVLYELVAPEGTRVPKGAKPGSHPVAMLQNGMKDMLRLEHQLQYIDYTKANMLHADMSPDDFSKSMSDRGESYFTMFARMMGQAIAQQSQQRNKTSEFDLLAALFDSDRAGALKRLMAEQFEGMEGAMDALDGPRGSTIVSERNKVALKKLTEQIAQGKKKIAIFYGAGHMSDFEKRLAADFHLRRSSEEWLTAWKLDKTSARKAPAR
jgi:hypothetical protein